MRTIPIATDLTITLVDESNDCSTENGEVPKLDIPLTRRSLLRGSGLLMGTIAAGSSLALLAPSTVWALELKILTSAQGETLLKMGRTLYPHKRLPDAVYAILVKDLDAKAAGDQSAAKILKEGIDSLDKAAGGTFSKLSEKKRKELIKGIETQPFFAMVRGQCITSLYDNDMAYKTFGYPGSAWEKGGYITRGFQDLKWLPAPPASASPAPYLG